jgi:hypothetical protein
MATSERLRRQAADDIEVVELNRTQDKDAVRAPLRESTCTAPSDTRRLTSAACSAASATTRSSPSFRGVLTSA